MLSKINLFKEIYKDPDRKPIFKIISEVLSLAIYHRCIPRLYFSRYLFKVGRTNIKNYLPSDFLDKVTSFFNDKEVTNIVENKLYFNFFYSQFKISLPKIFMYNHRKMFVVGNNSFEINSVHDFKVQIENIFKQNPSYDSIFIKKTYGSYGGNNVYRLSNYECKTDAKRITDLYYEVIKTGFLFQETIKQHSEMNRLNPSCLNSIRIDTFIDSDEKVEIISAFVRISVKNSHIDNNSFGGYAIGINLKDGKLKKEGYTMPSYGIKVLTAHPITYVIFENFKIPFFDQVKELVKKAASFMPGLRLIGWDVAIGESGPILIEGNSGYATDLNELLDGGYRDNATYQKVLREYNYSS